MRIKNLNNTAFSLLEVLLASIIFVVTIAGVFATLNAVRAPVASRENELAAAVFSKQVLETLRSQTSQNDAVSHFYTCLNGTAANCADFALSVGTHNVTAATLNGFGLKWPTAALSN